MSREEDVQIHSPPHLWTKSEAKTLNEKGGNISNESFPRGNFPGGSLKGGNFLEVSKSFSTGSDVIFIKKRLNKTRVPSSTRISLFEFFIDYK